MTIRARPHAASGLLRYEIDQVGIDDAAPVRELREALALYSTSVKTLELWIPTYFDIHHHAAMLEIADLVSQNCSVENLEVHNGIGNNVFVQHLFRALNRPDAQSSLKRLHVDEFHLDDQTTPLLEACLRGPLCKLETLELPYCNYATDETISSLLSTVMKSSPALKHFIINVGRVPGLRKETWLAIAGSLPQLEMTHFSVHAYAVEDRSWGRDATVLAEIGKKLLNGLEANHHLLHCDFNYWPSLPVGEYNKFKESTSKLLLRNRAYKAVKEIQNGSVSAPLGIRALQEIHENYKSYPAWKATDTGRIDGTLLYELLQHNADTEIMEAVKGHFVGRKRKRC